MIPFIGTVTLLCYLCAIKASLNIFLLSPLLIRLMGGCKWAKAECEGGGYTALGLVLSSPNFIDYRFLYPTITFLRLGGNLLGERLYGETRLSRNSLGDPSNSLCLVLFTPVFGSKLCLFNSSSNKSGDSG